jgi:hypothetical protein
MDAPTGRARPPRHRRRLVAGVAGIAVLAVTVAAASTATAQDHKVTLCHATASRTNPYVSITVDYHSIVQQGHGEHDGPVYVEGIGERWGDIIPAFDLGEGAVFDGQNLDSGGHAILDGGCVAAPTTTTTVSG